MMKQGSNGAKDESRRCTSLDLDLYAARQPVLERDTFIRSHDGQLHAHLAIADFACDLGHGCPCLPELRPRKPIESNACHLSGTNASERGLRYESGNHSQIAAPDDGSQMVAFVYESAGTHVADLSNSPACWRSNAPTLDFVLERRDLRANLGQLGFDSNDIALQPHNPNLAIGLSRDPFTFQLFLLGVERGFGRSFSFGIGLGTENVDFWDRPAVCEAIDSLEFLTREERCDLGFLGATRALSKD
ncbi:hypothetical protein LVJ94_17415 [Pendulispora rubella]|uniref:Uncharacterized protein n=1 Tax=Pendulispora rubella TaxID=2741070 RepID=A0ABZ2LHF9_9BACT